MWMVFHFGHFFSDAALYIAITRSHACTLVRYVCRRLWMCARRCAQWQHRILYVYRRLWCRMHFSRSPNILYCNIMWYWMVCYMDAQHTSDFVEYTLFIHACSVIDNICSMTNCITTSCVCVCVQKFMTSELCEYRLYSDSNWKEFFPQNRKVDSEMGLNRKCFTSVLQFVLHKCQLLSPVRHASCTT